MKAISIYTLVLFLISCAGVSFSSNLDTTDTAAAESLGYTDIGLRDTNQALIADFTTPAPIVDRLLKERSVNWSQLATTPENLTRFSFGIANSNDVFVLSDTGDVISSTLKISNELAEAETATNDLLLRSIFQFVLGNP